MTQEEMTEEEERQAHRSLLTTLKHIIEYYEDDGKKLGPFAVARDQLEYVYISPLRDIIYIYVKKI